MSAPDWPDDALDARDKLRKRFAPGTRVTHAYSGAWQGEIVKLYTGTLKRPRRHQHWTAGVRWDHMPASRRPGVHELGLLRPVK